MNKCPHCGEEVSLSLVEGLKLTNGLAFNCNECGTSLILDYWHSKIQLFRLVFVLGVFGIMFWLPKTGLSNLTIIVLAVVYALLGWLILLKIRRIRYADNRLHEQEKQKKSA